jgi:hypothetical protein
LGRRCCDSAFEKTVAFESQAFVEKQKRWKKWRDKVEVVVFGGAVAVGVGVDN